MFWILMINSWGLQHQFRNSFVYQLLMKTCCHPVLSLILTTATSVLLNSSHINGIMKWLSHGSNQPNESMLRFSPECFKAIAILLTHLWANRLLTRTKKVINHSGHFNQQIHELQTNLWQQLILINQLRKAWIGLNWNKVSTARIPHMTVSEWVCVYMSVHTCLCMYLCVLV